MLWFGSAHDSNLRMCSYKSAKKMIYCWVPVGSNVKLCLSPAAADNASEIYGTHLFAALIIRHYIIEPDNLEMFQLAVSFVPVPFFR